ncbi:hypothetical protein J6590_097476 [Homalodisca vitripennis]|nr:hypothetical protein J6590_097476 [Homalodisca vitripennis]
MNVPEMFQTLVALEVQSSTNTRANNGSDWYRETHNCHRELDIKHQLPVASKLSSILQFDGEISSLSQEVLNVVTELLAATHGESYRTPPSPCEQSDRDRRHLARRNSSRGEVLTRLEQRYLHISETLPPRLPTLRQI